MASGVETCRTTSPGDQTRRSERGDVAVYVVHAYTQRLLRTERVSGRQQHRRERVTGARQSVFAREDQRTGGLAGGSPAPFVEAGVRLRVRVHPLNHRAASPGSVVLSGPLTSSLGGRGEIASYEPSAHRRSTRMRARG